MNSNTENTMYVAPPFFRFYPHLWMLSHKVKRMSDMQRGWYIALLSVCWLDNGLADEPDHLFNAAGADSRAQWDAHSALVLSCFFRPDPSVPRLHNKVLMEELAHISTVSAKRAAARAAGIKKHYAAKSARSSKSHSSTSVNKRQQMLTTPPRIRDNSAHGTENGSQHADQQQPQSPAASGHQHVSTIVDKCSTSANNCLRFPPISSSEEMGARAPAPAREGTPGRARHPLDLDAVAMHIHSTRPGHTIQFCRAVAEEAAARAEEQDKPLTLAFARKVADWVKNDDGFAELDVPPTPEMEWVRICAVCFNREGRECTCEYDGREDFRARYKSERKPVAQSWDDFVGEMRIKYPANLVTQNHKVKPWWKTPR